MVVSTINKESFKERMTSCAAAADICKTSLSHLVNFWSCVYMKALEIMRPKQTTRENTLLGKLGAEEKVPLPSSPSLLHLALHDVIRSALAAPLWDQTEKLCLEFYSVNYFEIFFSYFLLFQEFPGCQSG